jgi:hypothetical protein
LSLVELATEELARRFGSSQACWQTVVDELYRVLKKGAGLLTGPIENRLIVRVELTLQ